MSKLSSLAATLNELADNTEAVKASLNAFKAGLGDTEIPADAQTALDRLTGDVAALASDVPAPAPSPAPSPAQG